MSPQLLTTSLNTWCEALLTKNTGLVASLYSPSAVLVPTISNQIRTTPEEISDYFIHFLAKGPQCSVELAHQITDSQIPCLTGIYTFNFDDNSTARARFTFCYTPSDSDLLISHHHSSLMPE